MRKPTFCICGNKVQISFAVTAKLNSAFVFATRIIQSLFYLNPKFPASSHLLWLHSPVCVGPGWKPRRPVFSEQGSIHFSYLIQVHQLGANRIVLTALVGHIVAREPWTRHRVVPACILQLDSLNVKLAKLGKPTLIIFKKKCIAKTWFKDVQSLYHWVAPVAEWVTSLNFSALNHSIISQL